MLLIVAHLHVVHARCPHFSSSTKRSLATRAGAAENPGAAQLEPERVGVPRLCGAACIVSWLVRGLGSHRAGTLAHPKQAGILLSCLCQGLILPFSTPAPGDAAEGCPCSCHATSQPPGRTRVCSNEASAPQAAWLHPAGQGRAAEGLGHSRLRAGAGQHPCQDAFWADKSAFLLFCRTKWWPWMV